MTREGDFIFVLSVSLLGGCVAWFVLSLWGWM